MEGKILLVRESILQSFWADLITFGFISATIFVNYKFGGSFYFYFLLTFILISFFYYRQQVTREKIKIF